MFRKLRTRVLCLALTLALLILLPAPSALAVPKDPAKQLSLLQEIDRLIAQHFIESDGELMLPDGLTPEDFDEKLDRFFDELDKLTEGFDDWSWFAEKELYDMVFGPEGGGEEPEQLYGIGILLDPYRAYGAYIYQLLPGGAAEEAGLLPGDQITSVDGVDTRALTVVDIAALLRGGLGTATTIGVRHPGALEDKEYTLTRRALPSLPPYVSGYVIEDGVGYISITSFNEPDLDVQAFALFMDHFQKRGVTDLIIDLRYNSGGFVQETHEILCLLDGVQGETLFSFVDRDGGKIPYTYTEMGQWSPERVIILVNEGSASASEIMAGSLQDRGLATLVGTQTFGKACAQLHFVLSSGDILSLTQYRIELPETGNYHGAGLTPDVEIELEIVTLDVSALMTLDTSRAILPGLSPGSRTLALEQRLKLLGYFLGEPDEVFDAYTLHALNCFQMSEELAVTTYGSVQTLELLEAYIEQVDGYEYLPEDNQLDYALEMLRVPAQG